MSIAQNAGIAGLQNFQKAMDVLGNNIANVNTTGYKSSTANFEDSLAQSLHGATSPNKAAGLGGINPLQLGSGASLGSVTGNFGQGNLQTTGNTTDMAIQGDAFFTVSNGSEQFYTRDGAFSLDAAGHLAMPGSGLILQGYAADSDGTISDTATVGNVTIPYDTASPAKATTQIDFSRNLNADSEAQGTVLVSKSFMQYAGGNGRPPSANIAGTEPLDGLMDSQGRSLHLVLGTKLTFSASSGGVDYKSTYQVQAGDTYNTLHDKFKAFLQSIDPSVGLEFQYWGIEALKGALTVVMGTKEIDNLQVSSDDPTGASVVAQAFSFPSQLLKATNPDPHTDTLRSGAVAGQVLRDSYTADGTPLTSMLTSGDQITVHAAVGGQTVGGTSTLTYDPATTTWQNLMDLIQNNLQLPGTDKTSDNQPTVFMDAQGSDDNIPDGAIVVRGLPGTAFSLSDLQISVTNAAGVSKNLSLFTSNAAFTETQAARDAGVATTSIVAYDSLGASHDVSVTFTKSQTDNEWYWQAGVTGSDQITGGGAGKLTFGADGTVSSFSFADGSQKLQIAPGNGAPAMDIDLDPGGSGKFSGLTQFSAATTAAATSQDGHAMGSLSAISIGKDGILTGQFTNGTTRSLAQVAVADFTNPAGLERNSNSVYAKTANSGDPVVGKAGSQSNSSIASGSLELSNVDLAGQLTDMVTYQRAYQANAKVITTSDAIMQELLGMIR